jgi:hypothetical protein
LKGGDDMPISNNDIFPLWSFRYMETPEFDKKKMITARGRTWQEAWICVQSINHSFMEPNKVGVMAAVLISEKEAYTKTHHYDWLHEAPLWLKIQEERTDLIW